MQRYIDECLADLGRINDRIEEVGALPFSTDRQQRLMGLHAARGNLVAAIREMQERTPAVDSS